MKESWKMVKLGEVCEKITDGSHNPPKGIEHSNYFMLSSQNVQDGYLLMDSVRYLSKENFEIENKRTKAQNGDVLLTIVGTIGRACVLKGNEGNITFQRSVALMKPIETLDSYYLMYYFLCQNKDLNLKANGAAQKGIYLKQLVNYPVILPPLEEQHRIVGILDAAFAKIDALKANAEANLANAKALFQQVLAQELQLKEGWVENKLGEIYDVRDGTHDSPKYYLEGYPLVTSKNLKETGLDLSNVKYINEKDYHAINLRSKVDVGDILFAMIGTIGNPVQVTEEPNYAIKNMALFKVGQSNSSEYLKYFLLSSIERMRKEANGTTQKFVSLNYLRNFIINLPPLEEQHRIVSTLDTLSEKCRRLEQVAQQTIRECDALKQSILRQAFSGEL